MKKEKKIPTEKQIEAEIKKLAELKSKVRPTTLFGDSNIEKIDAQIAVLENRMDEDEVYSRGESAEEDGSEDDYWSNPDVQSCAIEACEWLSGAEAEPPHKDWLSLVIK